ncbi:MAG: hypothetical protein IPO33_05875 [Saprospiraceae bacterium]|nr:hypothetical protein [Candidatus Brachybacter algidus]
MIFENTLQLSLSKLKEWGFLKKGIVKSSILTWRLNEEITGSIKLRADNLSNNCHIEMEYKIDSIDRKQTVFIVLKESNLKKGQIMYFKCSISGKLCRKLYLINGYFVHREAFFGCMYESQIKVKQNVFLIKYSIPLKLMTSMMNWKENISKKTYAGKPTKSMKLTQRIEQIEKMLNG